MYYYRHNKYQLLLGLERGLSGAVEIGGALQPQDF